MTIQNLPRIVQIGAGVAGVAGGAWVGNTVIKNAFRQDLIGSPSRVVEMDDQWIIDQARDPQGPGLTKGLAGAGAIAAGVGAVLSMGAAGAQGWKSLARLGGGALLLAAGTGLVVGAIAGSMQYSNADVRPV